MGIPIIEILNKIYNKLAKHQIGDKVYRYYPMLGGEAEFVFISDDQIMLTCIKWADGQITSYDNGGIFAFIPDVYIEKRMLNW